MSDSCADVLQVTKIQRQDDITAKFALLESINTQTELEAARSAGLLAMFDGLGGNATLDEFKKYRDSKSEELQLSFTDQEAHSYIAQFLPEGLADKWLQCVTDNKGGLGLYLASISESSVQVNLVYSGTDWPDDASVQLASPIVSDGEKLTDGDFPDTLTKMPLNVPLQFSRTQTKELKITLSIPPALMAHQGGVPVVSVVVPPNRPVNYVRQYQLDLTTGDGLNGRFIHVGPNQRWDIDVPNLQPGSNVMVLLEDGAFLIDGGKGYWLTLDLALKGQPVAAEYNQKPGGEFDNPDSGIDRTFHWSVQFGPVIVPWDGRFVVTITNSNSAAHPGGVQQPLTATGGKIVVTTIPPYPQS